MSRPSWHAPCNSYGATADQLTGISSIVISASLSATANRVSGCYPPPTVPPPPPGTNTYLPTACNTGYTINGTSPSLTFIRTPYRANIYEFPPTNPTTNYFALFGAEGCCIPPSPSSCYFYNHSGAVDAPSALSGTCDCTCVGCADGNGCTSMSADNSSAITDITIAAPEITIEFQVNPSVPGQIQARISLSTTSQYGSDCLGNFEQPGSAAAVSSWMSLTDLAGSHTLTVHQAGTPTSSDSYTTYANDWTFTATLS